jgi:hypothetical protein
MQPSDLGGQNQKIASPSRLTALGAALGAGFLAVIIYALQTANGWTVFASALMLACAAVLVGGTIGFLFGIPRTLTGDLGPELPLGADRNSVLRYGANTNLEQISDWLTKILVGIGIAQFGAIRRGAGRLFTALAPSLGGQPTSVAFAGALMVYFGLLGFLTAWLLTRLFLAPALSEADRRILQTFLNAEVAEAKGDKDRAKELRQQALDLLEQAERGKDGLSATARNNPPGSTRARRWTGWWRRRVNARSAKR